MREKVIKKIRFNYGSYFVVKIDHEYHTIEFESLGGASPNWDSFKNFCLSDRDIVKELKWALTGYRRKYPIYIGEREGMSGCYDITLYVSKAAHEWAEEFASKEVLSLHISCAGKLNEGIPDMFVGDLLEILYHMDSDIVNNIGKEKRKYYGYVKRKKVSRISSVCGSIYSEFTD